MVRSHSATSCRTRSSFDSWRLLIYLIIFDPLYMNSIYKSVEKDIAWSSPLSATSISPFLGCDPVHPAGASQSYCFMNLHESFIPIIPCTSTETDSCRHSGHLDFKSVEGYGSLAFGAFAPCKAPMLNCSCLNKAAEGPSSVANRNLVTCIKQHFKSSQSL